MTANPLTDRLGEPREVLAQLTPAESRLLATLIDTARARQAESLDAALESTLAALPRLIRIPARKILMGPR